MALQAENPDLMPIDPYQSVNGPVLVAEDDNGKIVGCAIGRRTVEAFMFLKQDATKMTKARATKKLASAGFHLMGEVGYSEAHVFTNDPSFAKLCEGLPGAHADSRHHVWVDLTEKR